MEANTGIGWLNQFASVRKRLPSNVYLMKCVDTAGVEFYKLGIADNIKRRLEQVQTGNPFKVELVDSFSDTRANVEAFEAEWHRRLAAYNTSGEWFKLPPDMVTFVRQNMRRRDSAFARFVERMKV